MKAALVYDRINKWGGAERVLLALHEIWPEAPLFTSVYNSKTSPWAKTFKVATSFLQNFPFAKQNHEVYSLLMPMAFESLNFDGYDVVISVTSEAAKGIITKPKTLHLCYCLTPTRYLWSGYGDYFESERKRQLSRFPVGYLRKWDKIAADRPDFYIAISKTVQARIKHYYHRECEVIYPPVETDKFKQLAISNKQLGKYFLVVSRLVKYKKVGLVVEAFNRLGWDLKIVGVGREMGDLRRKANGNIEFLGMLTDEELLSYYQNCQAVIFPTEEDFGIVPLEAMACGKPVVAFGRGGATETIVEGVTGEFFYPQTAEALVQKILRYKDIGILSNEYDPKDCRKQAEKFGKERFKKGFKIIVEDKWKNHIKTTCMR